MALTSSSFSFFLASAFSFYLACSSFLIMKSKLALISAIFSNRSWATSSIICSILAYFSLARRSIMSSQWRQISFIEVWYSWVAAAAEEE
jgi:hypothetical protein